MSNERSRIIWEQEGSWRVRAEQVVLPDGVTLARAFIEHPGSVAVVALSASEQAAVPQVLMLRQYRPALDETILELPAGTRGWDEDWLACAQRELREETDYRAANFTPLGEIWPAPGVSDELMRLYLAQDLSLAPLAGDVDEEITVVPMALDELLEMAQDGRIRDAKTVVGLWRTAVYLNR